MFPRQHHALGKQEEQAVDEKYPFPIAWESSKTQLSDLPGDEDVDGVVGRAGNWKIKKHVVIKNGLRTSDQLFKRRFMKSKIKQSQKIFNKIATKSSNLESRLHEHYSCYIFGNDSEK